MHPLPQSLPKECRKAEKILKSFMEPGRTGLDGVRVLHLPRGKLLHQRFSKLTNGGCLSDRSFPATFWRRQRVSASLLL